MRPVAITRCGSLYTQFGIAHGSLALDKAGVPGMRPVAITRCGLFIKQIRIAHNTFAFDKAGALEAPERAALIAASQTKPNRELSPGTARASYLIFLRRLCIILADDFSRKGAEI